MRWDEVGLDEIKCDVMRYDKMICDVKLKS